MHDSIRNVMYDYSGWALVVCWSVVVAIIPGVWASAIFENYSKFIKILAILFSVFIAEYIQWFIFIDGWGYLENE